MTFRGTIPEVAEQLAWVQRIPAKRKLLVPGNHDWLFQLQEPLARQMCNDVGMDVLIDEEVIIDGRRFYGTPAQPVFFNWAFNLEEEELEERYARIPPDADALITHCPMFGVLDTNSHDKRIGAKLLAESPAAEIPLHIFGHNHQRYGIKMRPGGKLSVNAAHCNEGYLGVNAPITLHI
jgi:Icc-related predicted phosphoesterase